ncbi:hypothetical protein SDRG_02438 [Saprolegnia diclina VS20]|uniref:PH domain-containing protein n=1 Tax=Saprolegnia diclina (strain VS20) TaxID=1156394 RepID=T0S630_SAPDV|nr:hypothetical protein SDRG_02438 [Saprolegnia diclina VS20]EQC40548.1 hypothetical protein SDRG_02438 [Saprolegnia diclina VS20]|eukprot:XP_008606247.1 hypothetical protein SDRG_02438 [Saprolegnia diclina VS20]
MYGINGAVVHHLACEAKAGGILATGDVLYKVGETNVLFRPYSVVMGIVAKAAQPCVLQLIPHALVADVVRSTLLARAPVRLANLNSSVAPEVVSNPALDHALTRKIHGSLREGQLYRQGVLFKFWHARYFVLTPTALLYYASPRSPAPRRELTFAGRRCSVQSLRATKKFGSVAVVHLLRVCVDHKHIVLACATESDKTAWLTALQQAMTQSLPSAPSHVMAAA